MTNLTVEKATVNQVLGDLREMEFPDEKIFFNTTYGAPYGRNINKKNTMLNHMRGLIGLFAEWDAMTQDDVRVYSEIEGMYKLDRYTGASDKHKNLIEDMIQTTKDIDGGEGDMNLIIEWLQEIADKVNRFDNTIKIDAVE